jgi:hypothetical protein
MCFEFVSGVQIIDSEEFLTNPIFELIQSNKSILLSSSLPLSKCPQYGALIPQNFLSLQMLGSLRNRWSKLMRNNSFSDDPELYAIEKISSIYQYFIT